MHLMMMKVQKIRSKKMGKIILTGISHKGHAFELIYPIIEDQLHCIARCSCGYEVDIPNFSSYGATRYLQIKWEEHVASL